MEADVSVLVTGGAGYIGSVVVDHLAARGEQVIVIDDLSRGHRDAVNPAALFCRGSVGDRALVQALAARHQVHTCLHFAGLIAVAESVADPVSYYEVNVAQTIHLLQALLETGVSSVVFSSSAAVYGNPVRVPIPEDHPMAPTSPYGEGKAMVERVLSDLAKAGDLRSVALRYFNAAGATDRRGEHHDPETHLIPLALASALGRRGRLMVYGNDYPTPDGTAVRDYVHVDDLARAHLAALDYLDSGGRQLAANLGNGAGYSVLEVVECVGRVAGRPVPYEIGERRAGDPARLVAGSDRAREQLGWQPETASLDDIVASAWRWETR
jgi:UDP-glucose 4-epimerase